MSDTNDRTDDQKDDDTMTSLENVGPDQDWPRLALLRGMLVDEVYKPGGKLDVVIQAGGRIISGTAVSMHEWFDTMMRNDPPRMSGPDATIPTPVDAELRHVNLINVRMLNDASDPGITVTTWQVPLSKVEGWTLGSIGTSERAEG